MYDNGMMFFGCIRFELSHICYHVIKFIILRIILMDYDQSIYKKYMEINMIFSLIADICTQQLDTEEHVKI